VRRREHLTPGASQKTHYRTIAVIVTLTAGLHPGPASRRNRDMT